MISIDQEIKKLNEKVKKLNKLRDAIPDLMKSQGLNAVDILCAESINPEIEDISFNALNEKDYYVFFGKVVLETIIYSNPYCMLFCQKQFSHDSYIKIYDYESFIKKNNIAPIAIKAIDDFIKKKISKDSMKILNINEPYNKKFVKYIMLQ